MFNKLFFVARQLSVSSDSRLLDQEIKAEIVSNVIKRPGRPQRPKSELFLDRDTGGRSKRYSAFGGNSPYGKLEAYIKLEQLGEGSYATVFKGFSNLTKQVVALKVRTNAASMTDLFCRIIDEILTSYFWKFQKSSFDWCPLERDRFLHKYPPVMRMCQSSPQKSNHENLYSAHRPDFGCNLRPEEGQGR